MINKLFKFLILFITVLLIHSCAYAPLLRKDEYLLHSQNIKGNKNIDKDALTPLYQQLPNRKFAAFGTKTYLYFYLIGRKTFDTSKVAKEITACKIQYDHKLSEVNEDSLKRQKVIKKYDKKLKKLNAKYKEGNFLMRVIGEPPSLFDTSNIQATVEQFKNYYYTKGYFNTNIKYNLDTLGKNVSVGYEIKEHLPLKINKVVLEIEDSTVRKVYLNDSTKSLLKNGMIYDEEIFSKERDRTYKLMKDNGYYYFAKNYIFMDVDTSQIKNEAILYYIIKNPEKYTHKQLSIKSITFNIDKNRKGKYQENTTYKGIDFNIYFKKYSKKILCGKIDIKKGKNYSATDVQMTQVKLSQLQMFKYVNISFMPEGDSLLAFINASSLPKYQLSDEVGLNTNVNRQIPGPFGSVTFTNRNTLRGCEILDISLSAGVEGQVSIVNVNEIIKTTEINGNAGLNYPILLLPGNLKHWYPNFNPRTRIALNYLYSSRPDYNRSEIKGSISYQIQPTAFSRFIFSPLELNLLNPTRISDAYKNELLKLQSTGSNIIYYYTKSLVTDMSFTYINNTNNPTINKNSHFIKTTFEIGGLTPYLLASMTNNKLTTQSTLLGIPYYNYYKLTADYRIYKPIYRKSTLAFRIFAGYVGNYFNNPNGTPYIKFLYSGGLNSNRAWAYKRLGPGASVRTNPDGSFNYQYERPGVISLESNLEGRFKIWKWIGVAAFVDAGNVWLSKPDTNFVDGEFEVNKFYKQIAVGSGIGLRFDFSFFVLRLDVGIKTYDPARNERERFRLFKLTKQDLLFKTNQTIFNIGIGYPF